ncbi:hypothetical protein ACFVWR_09410 [Leifsonia sp. NPDC058292]|uniref:hypothetical protein n=1 Tax=Leifsonia sp. NPDC058292 TaxID=3346428 RepID=UPI0036DB9770
MSATRHSGRPPHFRRGRGAGAATLLAIGVLGLVSVLGATAASFVQTATLSAQTSGRIELGQGAEVAVRYPDPASPNVIHRADDVTRAPITTLLVDPVGDPEQRTARADVTLRTLDGSAASAVSLLLNDRGDGDAPAVFAALRFGVYADGVPLLPDGIPLSAAQIAELNGGTGIRLPVLGADGGTAPVVSVTVWLDRTAPREAYATTVDIGLTFTGETVAGDTIDVEATF